MRQTSRLDLLAVSTLASGIFNLFWSLVVFVGLAAFGILTFPFGCVCLPLGTYPFVLGIFEILHAAKLLRKPLSPATRPAYHIAVLEIVDALFGNLPALVVGITALILYNDPAVRRCFGES
jgi:hypothetical protein